MAGETDLKRMLETLDPICDPRRFLFASFPGMGLAEAERFAPVATVQEAEGLTVIADENTLKSFVSDDASRFAMITLNVHSSLDAVGLTAAVSKALAVAGISANMVAGAFHDHIFLPVEHVDQAVAILRNLDQSRE